MANQNKSYATSREGVTIFSEGGWDSAAMQALLNSDLDFILENISKPPELKIFIVFGAYGIHTSYRRKYPQFFFSVAYDSLSNTDTIYDPLHNGVPYDLTFRPEVYKYPNSMYPGNWRPASVYLQNAQGLKIYYENIWDTTNYYNRLLSIVEYAIANIEEIKKGQRRICLPGDVKETEISILTYDTSKLNAIPIKDWGFTIDPKMRHYKNKMLPFIYVSIAGLLVILFLVRLGIRRGAK